MRNRALIAGILALAALAPAPGATAATNGRIALVRVRRPPALAAVCLGVQALRSSDDGHGKARATVVISGAMVLMMVVWTVVESL